MEFFRIMRDIPFMRHALVFNVISLVTFIAAVVALANKGLHFGVDFTGGTVLEEIYHQIDETDSLKLRDIAQDIFDERKLSYLIMEPEKMNGFNGMNGSNGKH